MVELRDSNPWSPRCERDAFPAKLQPQYIGYYNTDRDSELSLILLNIMSWKYLNTECFREISLGQLSVIMD